MKNIIKSEIYRLIKNKNVMIIAILALLMSFVQFFSLSEGTSLLFKNMEGSNVTYSDGLNNIVIEMLKGIDTQVYFFLVFILCVWINDIKSGVIRNAISTGILRRNIYFGKYIALSIIATCSLAFYIILSYILGALYSGNYEFPIKIISKIFLGQSILYCAIIALTVMIAIIFRSKSVSVFLYLAGNLVLQLLVMMRILPMEVGHFDPLTLISSVAWNNNLTGNSILPISNYNHCILVGCCILVFSISIGFYTFYKQDIK